MSSLAEFLFPEPAQRNVRSILIWWERRRLPYNIALGAAGLASIAWIGLMEFLIPGGPRFVLFPWQPVVVFGIGANLCYTFGSLLESIAFKIWGYGLLPIGPGLYRMGLTFSLGLALLPGLVVTISLPIRLLLAIVGSLI